MAIDVSYGGLLPDIVLLTLNVYACMYNMLLSLATPSNPSNINTHCVSVY